MEGLSYSIVLIFTNGSPLDGIATKLAIDDAADTPMSIVFIGIGKEEDLNATKQQVLDSNKQPGRRQFLTFVHFQEGQNVDLLTEAALHDIPTQLESYFLSKEIYPLLGSPTDDVAVLPYNPASDIAVPMEINSVTGQVVVTEDVKPPETTQTKRSAFGELKKLGTKLKSNKLVGKLTKKLDKNTINMAKGKISQLIGKKLPF